MRSWSTSATQHGPRSPPYPSHTPSPNWCNKQTDMYKALYLSIYIYIYIYIVCVAMLNTSSRSVFLLAAVFILRCWNGLRVKRSGKGSHAYLIQRLLLLLCHGVGGPEGSLAKKKQQLEHVTVRSQRSGIYKYNIYIYIYDIYISVHRFSSIVFVR
jgi:hypothetical protein